MAALPFTFAIDFEGDQWTFFKIPYADLSALYGIDVVEVNVWRPLVATSPSNSRWARPSIVEVDAYYLPDTAGTSYQREHVKTSIAVQAIDLALEPARLLSQRWLLRARRQVISTVCSHRADSDPRVTPPCMEIVKFPGRATAKGGALVPDRWICFGST